MRIAGNWVWVLSMLFVASCQPGSVADSPSAAEQARVIPAQLDVARAPVTVAVILDTSESMTRHQLGLSRALVKHLLERLRETDQFGLVLSSDTTTIEIEPSYATNPSKLDWMRRLAELQADGHGLSNFETALETARTFSTADTRIVWITDGSPTWGNAALDELVEQAEGLELWTVGVGRNNEPFLRELGHYAYLSNPAKLASELAAQLFETIPDARAAQSP